MPDFPQELDFPTDLACPDTPDDVPPVVGAALESHAALRTAERQWNVTDTQSTAYRRIVGEYEQRLADALSDRANLREAMLAFGAYLCNERLPREHVLFCVEAAIQAIDARGLTRVELGLHDEIDAWALEGYDETRP